jgi:hypothetical protein
MDASRLSGYYLLNKFRWSLDTLTYKRNFPGFAKSFCASKQINYIRFSNCRHKVRKISEDDVLKLTDVIRSQFSLWYGSQSIKISDIPRRMLLSEVRSYKLTRLILLRIIDQFKIEKLVTINGRFTIEKAVYDLGKEMNLPVSFLESLSENPEKYEEFETSPHSITESNKKIMSQWQNESYLNSDKATTIAMNHMNERTSPTWKWRKSGTMSVNISKPYIAFFTTSDYEFSILDIEDNIKPKLTQFEVVEQISRVAGDMGLRVIVRGHPQPEVKHVGRVEDEIWGTFCANKGIEFVSSLDTCDSLELARNAYRNVVYYSSIAAEIAYLGYPVISTAPSMYKDSIPSITKETVEEIEIFLRRRPNKIPRESVYPWAYYMKNGGIANKTFDVAGLYEIYYESKRIDENKTLMITIRRLVSFLSNKSSLLNFVKNRVETR